MTLLPMTLFRAVLAASLTVVTMCSGQSLNREMLDQIGIDQDLDGQVPLELSFFDSEGKEVTLGDYLGERPAVLTLVYYECPLLCTQVLNGLTRSLRILSFDVGKEFDIITVSIDPGETPALAAAKKSEYVEQYGRVSAQHGWHFLTGGQEQIDRLTEAVGFHYKYDPDTGQYMHASGIMLLTPEGKLARYFYGIEYAPKDVRLGLVEASQGKIGNAVDQLLLLCYQYDPATGKYGLVIMNSVRIAGLLTVVIMATFVTIMLRRDRRGEPGQASPPV
jgi:protein SCO1/2